MKKFKETMVHLALFIGGFCVFAFASLGDSHPVPVPKTTTVTVPFSTP